MTSSRHPLGSWRATGLALAAGLLAFVFAGCDDDDDSPPPPPPAKAPPGKTPTEVARGAALPGIVVEIVKLTGASGADGTFQVGDTISVNFKVRKTDGTGWNITDFSRGRIMLSGPTSNYQRVIPEVQDVPTKAVYNADDTYTYTFATAIPAVYAAPINDSSFFGPDDGEWKGQPLQAGTYSIGLSLGWDYTVDGESFRDAGNEVYDFLFGGATKIESREVVGQDSCDQCHASMRFHGDLRREVTLCLLCHTSGSEDRNNPAVEGGSPGVTIDFRVMIHKIHNGKHLPAGLGVATNADGSRKYDATPKPYKVVASSVHDYSHIAFPVWPNFNIAMPRDAGYTALTSAQKAQEDTIRTGVTSCAVCHGDPDGTGPIQAPKQGGLAFSQPTRRACGSCHDDIDWSLPYKANNVAMPAQANDSACLLCHGVVNSALDNEKAHLHPLLDPSFNPGLNFQVTKLVEGGTNNNDGTIDPGEKVAITMRVTDDKGADVLPSAVASMNAVLHGPVTNNNVVVYATIPAGALKGSQPFTLFLPEVVYLESPGVATAALGDVFTTARVPHWDLTGALTSVWVRTATTGGNSTLSAAATPPANYLDVVDATGFARDDYVVLEDGVAGKVEYLRIQNVIGNRLWFSSPYTAAYAPGVTKSHAVGASVKEVRLTAKVKGTDFTVNAATGQITEVTEFGAGNAVVVTYTTDFVMPATYPLSLNDGFDFDDAVGEWAGKPIVDGTYSVTWWGARNLTLDLFGESNSYRGTARAARQDFLVGSAKTLTAYPFVADLGKTCNSCHQDLFFHGGGRRGYEACIACHGTAGSEDRPQYVAGNAGATTGVSVDFRQMLHKIHMGEELENASSYVVNGHSSAAFPNNFTAYSYEEVVFPGWPGGVQNCTQCHGASNTAWYAPVTRKHPTAQVKPGQNWRFVCGSCHDGEAAQAHIDAMSAASGSESCAVCHDPGKEWNVQFMHKQTR